LGYLLSFASQTAAYEQTHHKQQVTA
jgi:hypothetical protein